MVSAANGRSEMKRHVGKESGGATEAGPLPTVCRGIASLEYLCWLKLHTSMRQCLKTPMTMYVEADRPPLAGRSMRARRLGQMRHVQNAASVRCLRAVERITRRLARAGHAAADDCGQAANRPGACACLPSACSKTGRGICARSCRHRHNLQLRHNLWRCLDGGVTASVDRTDEGAVRHVFIPFCHV